jgi:glycine cleavage system pyridoxal-binding protein P
VCQTCLSSLAYEVDGKKTFKTLVYTPGVRGVSEQDSAKALEEMKEKGAILVEDEDALRQALGK